MNSNISTLYCSLKLTKFVTSSYDQTLHTSHESFISVEDSASVIMFLGLPVGTASPTYTVIGAEGGDSPWALKATTNTS